MARDFKLPESTVAFLNVPRPRTEGMLPLESTIKQSIDTALEQMLTNNQRPEEIVDSLKRIRDGLRAKGSVSDGVYKVMGLPDTYVKEEREGVEKSIRRIDDAIRQLGSL